MKNEAAFCKIGDIDEAFARNETVPGDTFEYYHFFCWIKNTLQTHDICSLEFPNESTGLRIPGLGSLASKSRYMPLWQSDAIKFFFKLSADKQLILINKYNKEVVDRHNSRL